MIFLSNKKSYCPCEIPEKIGEYTQTMQFYQQEKDQSICKSRLFRYSPSGWLSKTGWSSA